MSDVRSFMGLLENARTGDHAALEELVRLYEPQLRIVARARLGSALRPYLDSVDLVQSVHRSLLLGVRHDKFDINSPQHLLALAMTLVRRKVARHWRRLQRQHRLDGNSGSTDWVQRMRMFGPSLEDPIQVAEFNDQVQHLCANLDADEQRVVQMRLEGFTIAEVARSMNIDPHFLRVRISRLRKRLRESRLLTEWL